MINREASKARCKPRDTVVDVYKELGLHKGISLIFPECVLVQRCENNGCCHDTQECKVDVNQTRNVSMLFITPTPAFRNISMDKSCSCQNKPGFCPESYPCPDGGLWDSVTCGCQCKKRCPFPFVLDRIK
uniref:Uncharacterized protein LOC102807434 n=1 Tax=Saccoglossus kowalevskii TaxID=10224 RepID=A0ABM0M3N5_SACKO